MITLPGLTITVVLLALIVAGIIHLVKAMTADIAELHANNQRQDQQLYSAFALMEELTSIVEELIEEEKE